MFKLGHNYFDYVKDSNDVLVQIFLGNNNINHKFNISNQNNIIKLNDSYIFLEIQFIFLIILISLF